MNKETEEVLKRVELGMTTVRDERYLRELLTIMERDLKALYQVVIEFGMSEEENRERTTRRG